MKICFDGINQEEFLQLINQKTMPAKFDTVQFADGIEIENLSNTGQNFDSNSIWEIVLSASIGIPISIFANYIYDILKSFYKKRVKIKLNDKNINLEDKKEFVDAFKDANE